MADYSFAGNGIFGGSSNLLGQLGQIGQDWSSGMNDAMKFGTTLLQYQNAVNTNPSAVRAQIAKNISEQGTAEGNHYRNYIMNGALSRLAGGLEPLDWQKRALNWGSVNGSGQSDTGGTTANVQGTPAVTQTNKTPATTVAKPVAPVVNAGPAALTAAPTITPAAVANPWAAGILSNLGGTANPTYGWAGNTGVGTFSDKYKVTPYNTTGFKLGV